MQLLEASVSIQGSLHGCSSPTFSITFEKHPVALQIDYHPFHSNLHQRSLYSGLRRLLWHKTYEEEALVHMIESKHKRRKKACCPKIGCSHMDVRMSDLIQDEALRREIESRKKKHRPLE
ncbi:E3 SUMO-protein ligase NSE2 [Pteropus alecto]|uniref:E3 SUMO-protein ligase NSE2 n=1 Tax=Pteropus alecto TaxID=9402 RepID=L5KL50_PTEAL|nr:E3 SUMO-protein ligase NSE2 [Pteropus alecto]